MAKNNIYHYFVEGECEEKLINTYKTIPYFYFQAGKVEVFNFINKKITNQRLMSLNTKTIIVLVYDIDVEKTDILKENVRKLNDAGFKVFHIQSINNFEDEIVYSTNLKNIKDMYNCENIEEFKKNFIKQSNLDRKLEKENFKIDKIWSRVNTKKPFCVYSKKESIDLIRKK